MDEISNLDKQYKNKAIDVMTTANIAVEKRHDFGSGSYLQDLCQRLVETDRNIRSVSISTVKRNLGVVVVASSDRKKIGSENDSFYDAVLARSVTIFKDDRKLFNESRILEVAGPLYSNGKTIAVVSVEIDFAARDIAIRNYIIDSITRMLMAMVLMSLLLYLAMRKEVFNPLWQLSIDAKEIARGNFNRRSLINSSDEFGELASEFNLLALYLQQREEENRRLLKSVKEKLVKAEVKSQTDSLTKLENRRSFQDRLTSELDRASRTGEFVSLLFCDLDKFKIFNDTNGHILGDKALFDVARIIRQSLRNYDFPARYGGEEFAIILPNTDTDEAVSIADRICKNVAKHAFTVDRGLGNMTISIGVATFPSDAQTKELLITSADFAMYESKILEGNCGTVFTSFQNKNPKKAS
ncbi:MAG: diguanylate cyclase [Rubrobacteridae bacterium]|nr:diguanylate cyclase [Rubrobacteridae bacterium]